MPLGKYYQKQFIIKAVQQIYKFVNLMSLTRCNSQLFSHQMRSKIVGQAVNQRQYRTYSKKKIGDYSYYLNDQIGYGYSSQVFKGYHKLHRNNILAIKVIKLSKITKATYPLLQNEIEILKSLDHQNIIKLHNVHYTENNCYIITDYCEGGTLQDYINKNQELDWENVVSQLVQACKYLAQKLIIHRDIKPQNVFRQNNRWKIGDFGFARYIQSKDIVIKQSYKVGSPFYMPPQTIKDNIYCLKTDSFALGILLFYMISKEFPWKGNNKKQLLKSFQYQCFPQNKINHAPAHMVKFITGLCRLDLNERLFIADYDVEHQPSHSQQIKYGIQSIGSYQTQQDREQQLKKQQSLPISLITDIIILLEPFQMIKLCKFLKYIIVNTQNMNQVEHIRVQIKKMIHFLISVHQWAHDQVYCKYVKEFEFESSQKLQKFTQLKEIQLNLQNEICKMGFFIQNRLIQLLRAKFIQLAHIIRLMISKQIEKTKVFICKMALHPDFSKALMSNWQLQQIQKLLHTYS